MHNRSRATGFALVAALAAACTPAPAPQAAAAPAVDSTAVRAAVADLWQRWITADTSGNLAALAGMVADSARLDLQGVPPILGRAAWEAVAKEEFKTAKYTSMTITPYNTTAISNELAYESGSFTEGSLMGKKAMMNHGRYAGAIRKDPDGQWRIGYIMVISDSLVPVKK